MTLSAMIFGSNAEMVSRLERRCIHTGDINLYRSPEYRPSVPDIIRLINSYNPELIFLELFDREEAMKTLAELRLTKPEVAIIGFADDWNVGPELQTSGGLVKVVSPSIPVEQFRTVVLSAMELVRTPPVDNVTVFIPSKAGSGASTLALNVTGALANQCGKSAILIEADLHSGPASMYLRLSPKRSVADALLESHQLEGSWNDIVTHVQNFSLLAASNIHTVPQVSPWEYRRLIAFVRPRYEHVVFDLPEVVNDATEAIVSNAHCVYVVCTPEVPSLILARRRCVQLIDRGAPEERLKIILNRSTKNGPEPQAIEEILGRPLDFVVPNEYQSLWNANLRGELITGGSALAKALSDFAWKLTGVEPKKPSSRLFGFLSGS